VAVRRCSTARPRAMRLAHACWWRSTD